LLAQPLQLRASSVDVVRKKAPCRHAGICC
jgi:hypothetical protein